MKILNLNFPQGQTAVCPDCLTSVQLEFGDGVVRVVAGTISVDFSCPCCQCALLIEKTRAEVIAMAIPVQLQSAEVQLLLAQGA